MRPVRPEWDAGRKEGVRRGWVPISHGIRAFVGPLGQGEEGVQESTEEKKRKPELDYLFDFLGTPELEEREK